MQTALQRMGLLVGIVGTWALVAPAHAQQPAPVAAPGSDANAYVQSGIDHGKNGDLEAAIEDFNQALKINPKDAAAYYNLGYARSLQNKADESMADYTKAIQIDPKYRDAYYKRGSLKGEAGDFDGAISDFSAVIQIDSKYASAFYNRGHAKYFKGDLDGAIEDIHQAMTLDPNSSFTYYIEGLIDFAQERKPEALADFQKSSGLNYPYAAFWVWIAEMGNAEHGLAQQDLTVALTRPASFDPNGWPTQIGKFLLGKSTQDQLITQAGAGDATEMNSRLCEAWFYAGIVRRFAGDSKGAQGCFQKAIATGSKSSEEYIEAQREIARSQTPTP